jgi:hypothetical protein
MVVGAAILGYLLLGFGIGIWCFVDRSRLERPGSPIGGADDLFPPGISRQSAKMVMAWPWRLPLYLVARGRQLERLARQGAEPEVPFWYSLHLEPPPELADHRMRQRYFEHLLEMDRFRKVMKGLLGASAVVSAVCLVKSFHLAGLFPGWANTVELTKAFLSWPVMVATVVGSLVMKFEGPIRQRLQFISKVGVTKDGVNLEFEPQPAMPRADSTAFAPDKEQPDLSAEEVTTIYNATGAEPPPMATAAGDPFSEATRDEIREIQAEARENPREISRLMRALMTEDTPGPAADTPSLALALQDLQESTLLPPNTEAIVTLVLDKKREVQQTAAVAHRWKFLYLFDFLRPMSKRVLKTLVERETMGFDELWALPALSRVMGRLDLTRILGLLTELDLIAQDYDHVEPTPEGIRFINYCDEREPIGRSFADA